MKACTIWRRRSRATPPLGSTSRLLAVDPREAHHHRRLGGKVNPREKGRYEITYVPPLLMDRNQQIGIGLPVQPRYERICFEKEHVADSPRAELVSPGHPLLEACISLVL